jgi:phage baseplate assembly protein W
MASRPTRADTLIGTNKKFEFFSDFLTSFDKTPVGNQLARVINEKSVNQSLKNIILTNTGERFFNPFLGSNITASIFENIAYENLSTLEFYIQNAIENNEPRVNLLGVQLVPISEENSLEITLVYNLINNPEPITFTFLLKRIR